jgi:hypothetical protein
VRKRAAIAGLAIGFTVILSGCAGTTRIAEMGRLPNAENLVTLVVSEDREVVARQCDGALAVGPIYGCQVTRVASLPDGSTVRLVKIVRYTDKVPSALALEIDVHELCHAVASLQAVADPCHVGNNGFLENAPRAVLRAY